MLSSSRIVFSEDIGGVSPWQPRQFGQADKPRDGASPEGQAKAAEAAPGFEEGLREGMRRGVEQARAEAAQLRRTEQEQAAQRLASIVHAATQALNDIQQTFAERVTRLAVEIARSATGIAIDLEMDVITPAVQKALDGVVDGALAPVVRLHPTDASLFGEALAPLLAQHKASLLVDPGVERGGCLVDTPTGRVDGTVATRWKDTLSGMGISDSWVRRG